MGDRSDFQWTVPRVYCSKRSYPWIVLIDCGILAIVDWYVVPWFARPFFEQISCDQFVRTFTCSWCEAFDKSAVTVPLHKSSLQRAAAAWNGKLQLTALRNFCDGHKKSLWKTSETALVAHGAQRCCSLRRIRTTKHNSNVFECWRVLPRTGDVVEHNVAPQTKETDVRRLAWQQKGHLLRSTPWGFSKFTILSWTLVKDPSLSFYSPPPTRSWASPALKWVQKKKPKIDFRNCTPFAWVGL